jgi:hypothetical protein
MALTGKAAQRGGYQYSTEQLAPLTGKITQGRGWRRQAQQLASTHTAVGAAAMALIGQAQSGPSSKRVTRRHRTADVEIGAENAVTPTKLAEPEQKAARAIPVTQIQNAHTKTPAASADKRAAEQGQLDSARGKLVLLKNKTGLLQSQLDSIINEALRLSRGLAESSPRAADQEIVEPEDELGSAREEIVHWKNKNCSLQKSLDLLADENYRLACCLTERDAALEASLTAGDEARPRLEQMKTALTAAEAELKKLVFALSETNENRQTEINTLYIRLEAMSSRAVTAEKLLADAQQGWLVHVEENSIAQHKIADAIEARNMTEKELERLRNSLAAKDRQLQELEQSRSELIESANTLLVAFKTRDTALARSEERIKMLTERVALLEAEVKLASQREIEQLNFQLQRERAEWVIAEGAPKTARTNSGEPQREFDNYITRDDECERAQMRSTQSLLADTVTFCNAA